MTYTILLRPEAVADLADASRWYDGRREGLGADFLLCVEEIFERIRREPEMYPPVHNQVRRALIRRFPYGVFYFTEEQNIIVVAVVHAHRAPHQWMSRS